MKATENVKQRVIDVNKCMKRGTRGKAAIRLIRASQLVVSPATLENASDSGEKKPMEQGKWRQVKGQ